MLHTLLKFVEETGMNVQPSMLFFTHALFLALGYFAAEAVHNRLLQPMYQLHGAQQSASSFEQDGSNSGERGYASVPSQRPPPPRKTVKEALEEPTKHRWMVKRAGSLMEIPAHVVADPIMFKKWSESGELMVIGNAADQIESVPLKKLSAPPKSFDAKAPVHEQLKFIQDKEKARQKELERLYRE